MMQKRNALYLLAVAVPILGLIAGCSSRDPQRDTQALETPAFLSSPGMALVTNTEGFSARVQIQSVGSAATPPRTGHLYGRGSHLLFVPEYEKHTFSKQPAAEKTYFVWDVAQSKGYMLNEALQGYAPYSISARVTTLAVTDVEGVFNDFDGHRTHRGEAVIGTSEGPEDHFTVWRATDLKGFPMQIKAGNGQFIVTFSQVNFEPVGLSLFTPPDGFTELPNPGTMLSTLLERQVNAKKKPYEPDEESLENAPEPGQSRIRQ